MIELLVVNMECTGQYFAQSLKISSSSSISSKEITHLNEAKKNYQITNAVDIERKRTMNNLGAISKAKSRMRVKN